MGKFRVGFIGTGKRRERPGPMGYAMAYQHAEAYRKIPDCELVACADIVEENARAFPRLLASPASTPTIGRCLKRNNLTS